MKKNVKTKAVQWYYEWRVHHTNKWYVGSTIVAEPGVSILKAIFGKLFRSSEDIPFLVSYKQTKIVKDKIYYVCTVEDTSSIHIKIHMNTYEKEY